MASPGTYTELQTEISSWMNRTDFTSGQLQTFINLAEADIRSEVKTRRDVVLATGTLTGEALTLPTTFREVRRFATAGKVRSYVEPQTYETLKQTGVSSGYYTIIGADLYVLGGASGTAYTLLYVAALAPFATGSDTNWLLQNYPQIYLYAACKHAAAFLKDPQGAQGYDALWRQAVAVLNNVERESQGGGQMIVRPDAVE